MANLKTGSALAIGVLMAATLPPSSAHADKRANEHYHTDSYGNVIAAKGHDNGKQSGFQVFLDKDSFTGGYLSGQRARLDIIRQRREIDERARRDGAAAKPVRFYTSKLLHFHVELVSKNVFRVVEGNDATALIFTTENCAFDGSSREATLMGSLVVFGGEPESTMTCNIGQVFSE